MLREGLKPMTDELSQELQISLEISVVLIEEALEAQPADGNEQELKDRDEVARRAVR